MKQWNETLETGHRQIDGEHQEFFRQLRVLKEAMDLGAGRERIVELIVLLQKYVLGHFAREEAYMRKVACPTLALNVEEHRKFAAKFERWLDLLTMGGAPVSVMIDVHRESSAWIENHITHVDCGLRGCREAG
jgi:hemerythrin